MTSLLTKTNNTEATKPPSVLPRTYGMLDVMGKILGWIITRILLFVFIGKNSRD